MSGIKSYKCSICCKKVCRVKKNDYFCPAFNAKCCCSSVVEHFLGKEEVTSSSLVNSSKEGRSYSSLFFLFIFLIYSTLSRILIVGCYA